MRIESPVRCLFRVAKAVSEIRGGSGSRHAVYMRWAKHAADSIAYGEKGGGKVLTCLFRGSRRETILQFD